MNIPQISHDYTSYGTFNVFLNVTDKNGCTSDFFVAQAVKLFSTPNVDFSSNYSSSCALPLDVSFTDLSTNADSPITTWLWTIEDSSGTIINSSGDQNPSYEFTSPGDYFVTLKVYSQLGNCIDSKTQLLSFSRNTVDFLPNKDTLICSGDSISFENLSVDGSGNEPLSYFWDFGDGTTSSEKNPIHQFLDPSAAPYDVQLRVTFANGCIAEKNSVDLIAIVQPIPHLIVVEPNESCDKLLATIATDGSAITYNWDVNYDGISPSFDLVGQDSLIQHQYDNEGVYTVYLESEDSNGCISTAIYDSVELLFPKADFVVVSGKEGCESIDATFNASISSNQLPRDLNLITNYYWDFENDGLIDSSSTSPMASHNYSSEGSFDVRLIVQTEANCFDTIVKNNFIKRGLIPTPSFNLVQADSCINTPLQLSNTSISNSANSFDVDSIIWNFGDGSRLRGNLLLDPSLNTVNHYYEDDTEDDGVSYNVSLQVFSYGCPSNLVNKQVEIKRPVARYAIVNGNTDCIAGGDPFNFNAYSLANPDSLSEGVEEYRWEFSDGVFFPWSYSK